MKKTVNLDMTCFALLRRLLRLSDRWVMAAKEVEIDEAARRSFFWNSPGGKDGARGGRALRVSIVVLPATCLKQIAKK